MRVANVKLICIKTRIFCKSLLYQSISVSMKYLYEKTLE